MSSSLPQPTTSLFNSANFTKTTESNNNYVNSTIIDSNHRQSNKQFHNNNKNIDDTSHQQIFSNFVAKHQPQSLQTQSTLRNPSIMPKNEPVKLVYPNNNNSSNTQPTIVTMNNNNRVTLSNAPVNGTITLSPMTAANQQGQQMQGGNIKIGQQQGSQATTMAPTLIFKNTNSTQGGTYVTTSPVTMSKTNNNQVRKKEYIQRNDAMMRLNFIFIRRAIKKKRTTAMTEKSSQMLTYKISFFTRIGAKNHLT